MLKTNTLIILQKITQALTGLITAIFVLNFLNPYEQGFFYTMGSLLNAYLLLDLGLSALIVQKSAKYFSGLSWDNDNLLRNNKRSLFFISFFKWVYSWYKFLSFLILFIIPLGYFYFFFSGHELKFNFFLPLVCMVLALSFSMPSIGILSVLEGAKKINQVYLIKLTHYIIGAALAWILLYSGYGIYAQSAAPFAVILTVYLYIFLRFKKLGPSFKNQTNSFSWRSEILPQQKRNCIGWFSNYIFLHTPVLVIFYYMSPAEAGKLGLTMVIANISISIAMSPITSITPKISELAKVDTISRTTRIFILNLFKSIFLIIFGTLFFYLTLLYFQDYEILKRILVPNYILIIFISFSFFYIVLAFMIFFRSYDKEPLAIPSFITIILFVFFGVFFLKSYGLIGFICTMLICLLLLFIYSILFFLYFIKTRK